MADDGTHPPGLRRATCSQGETGRMRFWDPRDDTGNREVWEENHFLIGKDVVYNQMLDPQFIAPEREANIGDFVKEGKWLARNLNPYRADGGGEGGS